MRQSNKKASYPSLLRYPIVVVLLAVLLTGGFVVWAHADSPSVFSFIVDENTKKAEKPAVPQPPHPSHITTPHSVKALYMTSWVAGTPRIRAHVVKLLKDTEANAVVIDIKDDTGHIAYLPYDPELLKIGSGEERIKDIREFIESLHRDGVYVIGRIATFQDPFMAKHRPDLAVRRSSDGEVWKDRKGISWIDAGASEHWEYIAKIGLDAYKYQGFDEINFDYIRFPSDGNMLDIDYRFYDAKKLTKPEQMGRFFSYIHDRFLDSGATISADLFGMTTTNTDDLGIGQVLEVALPYFDYVCPMVYPSHYPPTWSGYKNPAANPYEVIKISMGGGVLRAKMASTSPLKLRPWLQDFDMGATYTAEMVRAQMKATYDVGLTSWFLWDPRNEYTDGALLPE